MLCCPGDTNVEWFAESAGGEFVYYTWDDEVLNHLLADESVGQAIRAALFSTWIPSFAYVLRWQNIDRAGRQTEANKMIAEPPEKPWRSVDAVTIEMQQIPQPVEDLGPEQM